MAIQILSIINIFILTLVFTYLFRRIIFSFICNSPPFSLSICSILLFLLFHFYTFILFLSNNSDTIRSIFIRITFQILVAHSNLFLSFLWYNQLILSIQGCVFTFWMSILSACQVKILEKRFNRSLSLLIFYGIGYLNLYFKWYLLEYFHKVRLLWFLWMATVSKRFHK